MNKKLIAGVIGGLLITNSVTVYQFTSVYSEQENKINKQVDQIERLTDTNFERNNLLEKQSGEISTYKEDIETYKEDVEATKKANGKLNNSIEEKDDEINKLKKQLEDTKKKARNLP